MSISQVLMFEEGFRASPYLCSNCYPTVGYGKKLGPKCSLAELERLYDFILPEAPARAWLDYDLNRLETVLFNHLTIGPAMSKCSEPQRAVLISMAYQMGVSGLAAFKNTIAYIAAGEFECAAIEMLDSYWAMIDTPERAKRHSDQMRGGGWLELYS